jgi:O-succinylbenzoate synthase
MKPQRSYLLFKQPFVNPLQTSKGIWEERTSLVLRSDHGDGNVSFGEVGSLPGFWNFDLNAAEKEARFWCEGGCAEDQYTYLNPAITAIKSSIWKAGLANSVLPQTAKIWESNLSMKKGVIKRKIGIFPLEDEIPFVLDWLPKLPVGVRVRLDPNESFSREDLLRWTDALSGYSSVEFIEQPTGPKDDEWLIEFSSTSPIPIALDEALLRINLKGDMFAIPSNLYFVIKPILFSDWQDLHNFCSDKSRKIIFSTSFESPFGYEALIRMSTMSSHSPGLDRSFFCGNVHEFPEHHQPILSSPAVTNIKLAKLWDSLAK